MMNFYQVGRGQVNYNRRSEPESFSGDRMQVRSAATGSPE